MLDRPCAVAESQMRERVSRADCSHVGPLPHNLPIGNSTLLSKFAQALDCGLMPFGIIDIIFPSVKKSNSTRTQVFVGELDAHLADFSSIVPDTPPRQLDSTPDAAYPGHILLGSGQRPSVGHPLSKNMLPQLQ